MEQDMVTLGLRSLLVCEEVRERTAVYYKPSHYCLRKFQSGAGSCSTEQSAFRPTDLVIATPTPLMLPSPVQL